MLHKALISLCVLTIPTVFGGWRDRTNGAPVVQVHDECYSVRSSVPHHWCATNCYAPGTMLKAPACKESSGKAHQTCKCDD